MGPATTSRFARPLGIAVMALGLAAWAPASAEEELSGAEEYRIACLSCHGVGGKGDGPLAGHLKKAPPDLTQLAKNNNGHFPFLRVIHIIDGRWEVALHGARDMPVWGKRFREDDIMTARARTLELVLYLEGIQAK